MRILIALTCCVLTLGAQSPLVWGEQPPTPLTVEEREQIKDCQIEAYQALVRVKDAEKRREEAEKLKAQAQLDYEHATKDLDAANARIDGEKNKIVEKRKVSPELWDIDPKFEWIHKGATREKK